MLAFRVIAYLHGVQVVGGSNPLALTRIEPAPIGYAGFVFLILAFVCRVSWRTSGTCGRHLPSRSAPPWCLGLRLDPQRPGADKYLTLTRHEEPSIDRRITHDAASRLRRTRVPGQPLRKVVDYSPAIAQYTSRCRRPPSTALRVECSRSRDSETHSGPRTSASAP